MQEHDGLPGFLDLGDGRFETFGRPMRCETCGEDRFETRDGVMETRSSLFFSFAAASRGKTEFICLRCGRILSFART